MSANSQLVLPPYARSLGIRVARMERGIPLLTCEGNAQVEGRPGYWHGGVLAGLLEIAGLAAVQSECGLSGRPALPVTMTVQFMRGARLEPIHTIGTIQRAGRRLVNVTAEAWQGDRNRPVTSAILTFALTGDQSR